MKIKLFFIINFLILIVILTSGCATIDALSGGVIGKWNIETTQGHFLFRLSIESGLGDTIYVTGDNQVKYNDDTVIGNWQKVADNHYIFTPSNHYNLAPYGNASMYIQNGKLYFSWNGVDNMTTLQADYTRAYF